MAQHASITSFKPGQSGNPGGRLKGMSEIYALGRSRLHEIMAAMIEMALDNTVAPAARIAAAHYVTDRVLGRSPAVVKLDVDVQSLSDDGLDAEIARELARLALRPLAIKGPMADDDGDDPTMAA